MECGGLEGEGVKDLLYLNGQFSCGRENESLRLSQLNVHLLEHGNGESSRLPRPRLGPWRQVREKGQKFNNTETRSLTELSRLFPQLLALWSAVEWPTAAQNLHTHTYTQSPSVHWKSRPLVYTVGVDASDEVLF